MDPITGKVAAQATARAKTGGPAARKTAPSKFDQLRSEQAARLAEQAKVPPQAKLSTEQQTRLRAELERRLSENGPQKVQAEVRVERTRAGNHVESLKRAVGSLPEHSAFNPIRDRLRAIESQFAGTGKLLGSLGKTDDPGSLLKIQMQLFEVTRNVEVLSKVVDQVNSGIKTILQTQV